MPLPENFREPPFCLREQALLNLAHCEVQNFDVAEIVAFLTANPDITRLDLTNNNLTAESIKAIIGLTHLRELIISYNPIGDTGAEYLASSSLQVLAVRGCGITAKGVVALARHNKTITNLNIAHNRINDETKLTEEAKSCSLSLQALSENTTITHLNVAFTKTPFEGIKLLCQKKYTYLNYGWNNISVDERMCIRNLLGAETIIEALQESPIIRQGYEVDNFLFSHQDVIYEIQSQDSLDLSDFSEKTGIPYKIDCFGEGHYGKVILVKRQDGAYFAAKKSTAGLFNTLPDLNDESLKLVEIENQYAPHLAQYPAVLPAIDYFFVLEKGNKSISEEENKVMYSIMPIVNLGNVWDLINVFYFAEDRKDDFNPILTSINDFYIKLTNSPANNAVDLELKLRTIIITHMLQQLIPTLILMHSNKLYHRDIKPGNLLINDQGRVFITDFNCFYLTGRIQLLYFKMIPPELKPKYEQTTRDGNTSVFELEDVNQSIDEWQLGMTLLDILIGAQNLRDFLFDSCTEDLALTEAKTGLSVKIEDELKYILTRNCLPDYLSTIIRGLLAGDKSNRLSLTQIATLIEGIPIIPAELLSSIYTIFSKLHHETKNSEIAASNSSDTEDEIVSVMLTEEEPPQVEEITHATSALCANSVFRTNSNYHTFSGNNQPTEPISFK